MCPALLAKRGVSIEERAAVAPVDYRSIQVMFEMSLPGGGLGVRGPQLAGVYQIEEVQARSWMSGS